MNTGTILKLSFIGGLILTLAGAWLKIVKEPAADVLLPAGLVISLVFVVTALYEVLTSRRINRSEKVLWTLGFVFTGGVAGLVYLLSERRRVMAGQ